MITVSLTVLVNPAIWCMEGVIVSKQNKQCSKSFWTYILF